MKLCGKGYIEAEKKKKSTSIFNRTTVFPVSRQESHRGLALSECRVEACGERATGEPVEPENARARDLIVCLFMKLGTRLALSSLTSPFLLPQHPSLPPSLLALPLPLPLLLMLPAPTFSSSIVVFFFLYYLSSNCVSSVSFSTSLSSYSSTFLIPSNH